MTRPDVSVVVLSHRPDYVPHALASVLGQTYQRAQVLVQYSPDWWGDKLNDAVRATRGEFVVVLCDDDFLHPTYLATVLAAQRDSGADLVYTDTMRCGAAPDTPLRHPAFTADTLTHTCVPWMTALLRRSVFDDVGGYDPTLEYQDWDLWQRVCRAGARWHHVAEPLFYAREHPANGSRLMNHPLAYLKLRQKNILASQPPSPRGHPRAITVTR